MQKISINHDNSKRYTNKGIINIEVQPTQATDSVEFIISDSQFNNVAQTIVVIKDNNRATMCVIWIVNCTFKNNLINHHISIITAEVPSFNATVILFFQLQIS